MNANESILLAKDDIMVSTFKEIKESMEVNKMSIRKMTEEKESCFNKLDLPTKRLILNASAINPFDELAASPPSFTKYFFKQKNIGKAMTALEQHLQQNKVNFVPGHYLVVALPGISLTSL